MANPQALMDTLASRLNTVLVDINSEDQTGRPVFFTLCWLLNVIHPASPSDATSLDAEKVFDRVE